MLKTIFLKTEELFSGSSVSMKIPHESENVIPFAEYSTWEKPGLSIVKQSYNAKHSYIFLTEIKSHSKVLIDVECSGSDLYWLYLLKGSFRVIRRKEGKQKNFTLIRNNEYCLFYSPAQTYTLEFDPGHHLLFLFMVQSKWLHRYPASKNSAFSILAEAQQTRSPKPNWSVGLPIIAYIRGGLLWLFTLSKAKEMELDASIYCPIAGLISRSKKDLATRSLKAKNQDYQMVKGIRCYLKSRIISGPVPSNKQIANFHNVSVNHLNKLHRLYYLESLSEFKKNIKMEHIRKEVLESDKPISEIAYESGYSSPGNLSTDYKAFFKISPREDRKKQNSI